MKNQHIQMIQREEAKESMVTIAFRYSNRISKLQEKRLPDSRLEVHQILVVLDSMPRAEGQTLLSAAVMDVLCKRHKANRQNTEALLDATVAMQRNSTTTSISTIVPVVNTIFAKFVLLRKLES